MYKYICIHLDTSIPAEDLNTTISTFINRCTSEIHMYIYEFIYIYLYLYTYVCIDTYIYIRTQVYCKRSEYNYIHF